MTWFIKVAVNCADSSLSATLTVCSAFAWAFRVMTFSEGLRRERARLS
ncbi:DUF793 domain-containing protein, partial [Pseudomonas gessardii]|nr:DUF793 domain-containing protein [Pseudomonas gessardii]